MDVDHFRVEPHSSVRLADHDPGSKQGFKGEKEEALTELARLNERIVELQEVLYAQSLHKVLVVLQAMDAGGKDGTIRAVFHGVNPQGVKVASFKQPTDAELAHDFLWRIHPHTPGRGELVVFNRSHYEDVLVVRVHGLVPEKRWHRRYKHINDFEQLLHDEGATIVKVFLHVSKEEQARRFQERIDDPHKRWKFSAGDLSERERWHDYREAYEEALSRTSTAHAPWYVVPADHNWFRNLVVAQLVVDTLEGLDLRYPTPPLGVEGIKVS
jgi:PPK2 family polyphosphate:nucleotide phosphotransferase